MEQITDKRDWETMDPFQSDLKYINLLKELNLISSTPDEYDVECINFILSKLSSVEILESVSDEYYWKHKSKLDLTKFADASLQVCESTALILLNASDARNDKETNYVYRIPEKNGYMKLKQTSIKVDTDANYFNNENMEDLLSETGKRTYRDLIKVLLSKNQVPNLRMLMEKLPNVVCFLIAFQLITLITLHIGVFVSGPASISNMMTPQFQQMREEIVESTSKLFSASYPRMQNLQDNETLPLLATSYNDYQLKIHQISGSKTVVDVIINLERQVDWPIGVGLEKSGHIRKITLRGNLTFAIIHSILQEAQSLQELVFENTKRNSSYLCDQVGSIADSFPGNRSTLVHNNLKIVRFEHFTNCINVFSFLAEKTRFHNLHTLQFVNGTINDHNAPYIRKLLSISSHSLAKLVINFASWQTVLFDETMPAFLKMEEFNVDFLTTGVKGKDYLGIEFNEIFSSLQVFKSDAGFVPFSAILKLLQSQSLTNLTAAIEIPNEVSRMKMSFLENAKTSLEHVDILFCFQNKSRFDPCEVEGIELQRKRFSTLIIRANCDMTEI